ncbi:MAG: hypothetical protein EBX94_00365, partial [Burkholderiaceae bacterium]|nr:hypothetical protein [Burkholderiaceae bacterium]
MQEIPKYINHQGKVAVIITNIPRAGWYTEHKIKEAVFDPDIVNAILMDEDSGVIEQIAVKKYGRENFLKETLQVCTSKEDLDVRESYWISEL